MRKLPLSAFLCALALAGCESAPEHSLEGTWMGTFQSNPTKQVFKADKSYLAITETPKTRITQHGTWEASDRQLTILNGDAEVEGPDQQTNMQQQNTLFGNKGRKSIATLKWNGDNQVLVYNSEGDPPMVLNRQFPAPTPPVGMPSEKAANK